MNIQDTEVRVAQSVAQNLKAFVVRHRTPACASDGWNIRDCEPQLWAYYALLPLVSFYYSIVLEPTQKNFYGEHVITDQL